MANNNNFDVVIVGGSYSGLAAAMALGRALKKVLVIDDGKPCNIQTPHSHNFITHDGDSPIEMATLAKLQVASYNTIQFFNGFATNAIKTGNGFEIQTASGETFATKKIIFATGIRDIMPTIEGFAACWGISVLHCPYCHGYEVRNERIGILGNGDFGFDFARLISNWTSELTLYTNGRSTLTKQQTLKLQEHQIGIIETEIKLLGHDNGLLQSIVFINETKADLTTLYAPVPFEQHCLIPQFMGCEFTEEGYIQVDSIQETTVPGVFACGDNSTRMRTLANAVASGTTAGIAISKKMILEEF